LSTAPPHAEPEPEQEPEEGETAIAEYDYEAQEDNELSFPEGVLITNIERLDENWWAGEYDGKAGLFPCTNYPTPSNLLFRESTNV
jgi:drebrin-like protein